MPGYSATMAVSLSSATLVSPFSCVYHINIVHQLLLGLRHFYIYVVCRKIFCENGNQYSVDVAYNRATIDPYLGKEVTLTLVGQTVMAIAVDGEDIPHLENNPGDDDDDNDDSGSGACGTSADLAPGTPQRNARKRLRLSGGGSPSQSCKPPPAKAPRLEVNSDEELPEITAPKSRTTRLANARAKAQKKAAASVSNGVVDDSDTDMEIEFNDKDSGEDSS